MLALAERPKLRLKPFSDKGVDLIQFRVVTSTGRWPTKTIYLDCIQIKLSDHSSIGSEMAETMVATPPRMREKYVKAFNNRLTTLCSGFVWKKRARQYCELEYHYKV